MSTLKVNKIENIATTDGGISIDNTGHAMIDGVQMPTAGPLSNRNLIINGAMRVAQRGTSVTKSGVAAGYYSVDRFKVSSSDTHTQSQITLSSGDAPYSDGFRHAFRYNNDTASGAGANTYREIDYRVEDQDLANSGWDCLSSTSKITISFWLRASVGQTFYLYLRSLNGTNQTYVIALTVAANTWTKFVKTIPGNAGITLNNDNSAGLLLRFLPWYATTYTGSSANVDQWGVNNSDYVPDMTSTWVTTTNSTFDLTGLQLEVGEMATPFEHRSYGDELAKCQRYYYESDSGSYAQAGQSYVANGVDGMRVPFCWPVTMRTDPTVTFVGGSDGSSGASIGAILDDTTQCIVNLRSTDSTTNVWWNGATITADSEL